MSSKFFWGVLFILVFIGCSTEQDDFKWVTIEHEQYDFSIEYPTIWVVNLYGDSGRRGNDDEKLTIMRKGPPIGLPSSPSTFVIFIERRDIDNPTIQDAVNWGNEKIDNDPLKPGTQPYPGYEELLFQEEMISGYTTIRRRYKFFGHEGVVREEVYVLRENDLFAVSLWIDDDFFDAYYADFQRIVDSFETLE